MKFHVAKNASSLKAAKTRPRVVGIDLAAAPLDSHQWGIMEYSEAFTEAKDAHLKAVVEDYDKAIGAHKQDTEQRHRSLLEAEHKSSEERVAKLEQAKRRAAQRLRSLDLARGWASWWEESLVCIFNFDQIFNPLRSSKMRFSTR